MLVDEIEYIKANYHRLTNDDLTPVGNSGDSICYTCPDKTIDFEDNDLTDYEPINDWQRCGQLCKDNTQCKFWTYRTTDKKCWLKYSDDGLRKESDRISGTNQCTEESIDLVVTCF